MATTTVQELVVAFLDYAKATLKPTNYAHNRVALIDFLIELYWNDKTTADSSTLKCLRLVRNKMIQSGRFCWEMVNEYTVEWL